MRRRKVSVLGTNDVTVAEVYENLGLDDVTTEKELAKGLVVYEDSETSRLYKFSSKKGLYYTTTMTDGRWYAANPRSEWGYTEVYGVPKQMAVALLVILKSRLA